MPAIDDFGSRIFIQVPPPPPPSPPRKTPADTGSVASQLKAHQAQLARDEQAERTAALAAKANAASIAARQALQLAQAQAALSRAEVKRLQARLDLDNLQKRAHSASNAQDCKAAQQKLATATRVETSRLQDKNRIEAAVHAAQPASSASPAPAPAAAQAATFTSSLFQLSAPRAGAPGTPPFAVNAAFKLPLASPSTGSISLASFASVPNVVPAALTAPVPVLAPAAVPPGTAADAAAWTKKSLNTADVSQQVADKLLAKLGKTSPQDDPAGWEMYTSRRAIANQDASNAQQAIAAQLRLTYQGNPANTIATQDAAHGIADQFRSDPAAQKAVTAAQATVLTETPVERDTNTKLDVVNRQAATLDDLTGRLQDGDKGVTPADVAAARTSYQAAQDGLLKATQAELQAKVQDVPLSAPKSDPDPLGTAAKDLAARYAQDPELTQVVQAAVGIDRVTGAAPLGAGKQLDELGQVLPTGVDPSVKRLVMNDPGVKKAVQDYVDGSVKTIQAAYDAHGTVAAADALRDATDPNKHAGVTSQIAAQVINQAQPQITKIVGDVSSSSIKGAGGRPIGLDTMAGIQVADDLSQAVDVAAAGSDVVKKQYDTPEIQSAVVGVAQIIATHPAYDLGVAGFKDAVGHGYATLALQTAVQVKNLKQGDVQPLPGLGPMSAKDFDKQRGVWEDSTLGAIKDGLGQLQHQVDSTSKDTMTGMAPLLAEGKYAPTMTDAQFNAGQQALVKANPGLAKDVKAGYAAFDQLGYRLVRTGEAVSFYSSQLGDSKSVQQIGDARDKVLSDSKSTTIILASNSASQRMGAQVARNMLAGDLQNGSVDAQKWGIGAQTVGDLAEFLSETYVVKGINPTGPGGEAENIQGAAIEVTRSAHLPFFGGGAIWAGGGALQAAEEVYLFKNVHLGTGPGDPVGALRKTILLGLVGGFSAFHLMQAGMAVARISPHTFGKGENPFNWTADKIDAGISWLGRQFSSAATGDASWGLYVKEGSARDQWTRLAVEATPGLVKQLVGLMTIATVWDASGLFFNSTQLDNTKRDPFHFVTQSINLGADSILLRLQVREMALRAIGKKALQDPTFAAKAAADGLTLRGAGNVALKDPTIETKGDALASSRFLNWFSGVFATKTKVNGVEVVDTKLAQAAASDTWGPALRKLLFDTVIGEDGPQAVARITLFDDNPIGWVVNIGYMATAVANWVWDHGKDVSGFVKNDKTFLEAAGLNKPQADVMDQHHWFSGNAKSNGFLLAYQAQGGDASKFIDFINSVDPKTLDVMLSASENMDDHLDSNGQIPITQDDQAFLALPADPTKNTNTFTAITYDAQTKRYEDGVTQTYWAGGRWFYDPKIDNMMGETPARKDGLVFYDPTTNGMTFSGFSRQVQLTSLSGWQNWMRANALPMPPKANAPTDTTDYLSLPADPTQQGAAANARFSLGTDGRYHDSTTHMAYGTDGKWYFDPKAVGASDSPSNLVSYDPQTKTLYAKDDKTIQLNPANLDQFSAWLKANGGTSSTNAPPDNGQALPPAPSVPVQPHVYVVKRGDYIDKIAGFDPAVESKIYALNPWLNDRMAYDTAPVNNLPGQNPNYIDPGDQLILPEGYVPPKG